MKSPKKEPMTPPRDSQKKRHLQIAGICLLLAAAGVGVYMGVQRKTGAIPPMPDVHIDNEALSNALSRFRNRAESVTVDGYQKSVIAAYTRLNEAEAGVSASEADQKTRLYQFEQATRIGQTAKKERYLLLGDYLAASFQDALTTLLKDIQTRGLEQATHVDNPSYRQFIALGGSFFSTFQQQGIITEDGILLVADYVPQILFRRRWRMLGGLPHRWQFLQVEALLDHHFVLCHTHPTLLKKRIDAITAIKRLDPSFDRALALALVYYEGQETQRARHTLKTALKKQPNHFSAREFLLFMDNLQ